MYEKILVPVDGSPTSLAGLNEAIALARVMGSTIKLLHVVDEISLMTSFEAAMALPPNVFDLLKEAGQQVLSDAEARTKAAGIAVEAELFESYSGRVSDLILTKAKEWSAQIIVLAPMADGVWGACCWAATPSRCCASPLCLCCWCAAADRRTGCVPGNGVGQPVSAARKARPQSAAQWPRRPGAAPWQAIGAPRGHRRSRRS